MIYKDQREMIPYLPDVCIENSIEYLNETIEILLTKNIYTPLTPETVFFDIINKIPIVHDFKQAVMITQWQDKNTFLQKYKRDLSTLHTHYSVIAL
jgi:hypothetical protein